MKKKKKIMKYQIQIENVENKFFFAFVGFFLKEFLTLLQQESEKIHLSFKRKKKKNEREVEISLLTPNKATVKWTPTSALVTT